MMPLCSYSVFFLYEPESLLKTQTGNFIMSDTSWLLQSNTNVFDLEKPNHQARDQEWKRKLFLDPIWHVNKSCSLKLLSLAHEERVQSVGPQIVLCRLLFDDDEQRVEEPSLHRLLRARSTASGMWSVSILGLMKILRNAISLDHSAR